APPVHEGDARRTRRMDLHRRRRRQRIHLEAKIARGLVQIRAGDALHDERPATELHAVGVERFFGGLEVGVLELVAQGDERVVGVVVDRVDRIRAVRRRIRSTRSTTTDRKSTRLNSSHEWISYAVFCLKKKKKIKSLLHTAQTETTMFKSAVCRKHTRLK